MRRIYYMIKDWAEDTFGKKRDPEEILAKLEEELGELIAATRTYESFKTKMNRSAMQQEIADVQMTLFHLAHRYGMCFDTYRDGILIKHNVNKKRTWVKMPDGTFKHLPNDVEVAEPPKSPIGMKYNDPYRAIK
jgi:NTP pyrophosphatase (non-canonical NTP hydrolase)